MKSAVLIVGSFFLSVFAIAQYDTVVVEENQLELLTLADLYVVDMMQVGDSVVYLEWPEQKRDYVYFEFVSKDAYDRAFYSRRNEIIPAPQFGRNNGISVDLFCDSRVVNFTGVEDDSESNTEYAYRGYLPAMNALVVEVAGYEDILYSLIDKHTGEELFMLESMPQLSNDHSVLVTLNSSAYTQASSISISKREDFMSGVWIEFPNWMSAFDSDSTFWGMDGSFYFPVIRSNDRWNETGNLRPCFQFVKMSLVTPEQLAVRKLVIDFYNWHFHSRMYPDFIPSEESVVNEKYMMLDWNNQQLAEDELAATGFFTASFLTDYHQRAVSINADLMSGKMEYFQGYLPPYYEGVDFWCNCQDFPEDMEASTEVRIIAMNALGAEVEWSWDEDNRYVISLQRVGNEWRINKMQGF